MNKGAIFLICLAVVFSVGLIGGLFTGESVSSDWYESSKSGITPPDFAFPIVWNVLYFLIALSLYFAFTRARKKERKKVALIFGVNLILNALWSVLFFGLRKPWAAFVELIFLWLTIILMIFVVWKIDRKSAWLLVPYLLWVSFAGVLNLLFALG